VEDEIALAARSDVRVLITGERGVGKEWVTRLIHDRGRRARAPLISVYCSSVPGPSLEREIFGGPAGSAGGRPSRRGGLEAADRGTIFLSDVGDASARVQALIAHFLETGRIPVSAHGSATRPVDVRVIASTHDPLAERVGDQRFRDDLYYRLNVVHIVVPPLRERPEDIPFHMERCLTSCAGEAQVEAPEVTPEARQRLTDYAWPGNMRELRRVAEHLVRRCGDRPVRVADLPAAVRRRPAISPGRFTSPARGLARIGTGNVRNH
jgi:DNA-binding NtrC family response regulator